MGKSSDTVSSCEEDRLPVRPGGSTGLTVLANTGGTLLKDKEALFVRNDAEGKQRQQKRRGRERAFREVMKTAVCGEPNGKTRKDQNKSKRGGDSSDRRSSFHWWMGGRQKRWIRGALRAARGKKEGEKTTPVQKT